MKAEARFEAMEIIMGKDKFSSLLVHMINYRSDPEFWDEIIAVMGDDWLADVQARADQNVAEFKEKG